MKKSEAIATYADQIKEAMKEAYRSVLDSDGRVQYQIYVWDDGEVKSLEGPQGDTSYLVSKDGRELYYVTTVDFPCFDPWDQTDHSRPEDEAEAESERLQIIEYLMDEYDVDNKLDRIITEAELYEKYMQ